MLIGWLVGALLCCSLPKPGILLGDRRVPYWGLIGCLSFWLVWALLGPYRGLVGSVGEGLSAACCVGSLCKAIPSSGSYRVAFGSLIGALSGPPRINDFERFGYLLAISAEPQREQRASKLPVGGWEHARRTSLSKGRSARRPRQLPVDTGDPQR